ncbi:MAG: 1-deoxy-D-xylulose-5-phosphate synthase N-terminal domain-containing protein, partial [Clostridia bacterium]|nr:1-deoxy-D-xylulose-5-phosphate synthase N-terminal domain-containing protein [Clostridia bacterium]
MENEPILDKIRSPEDVKRLREAQLPQLCSEIRQKLIETVAVNGGHLASNLGVVELTVALHRVFRSPDDQIVWDVGHQCYAHKLLTGRYEQFKTIREYGGLSVFKKPCESECDPFGCGHSSTSISAATGLAKAKTLRRDDSYSIAVIGDGALTGGLAYEGMNNAGRAHDRLIVILNDNEMSISKNVGAIARHLAVIRAKPLYFKIKDGVEVVVSHIPLVGGRLRNWMFKSKSLVKNALYHSTIFEDMGFAYLGPADGHNIDDICRLLRRAKDIKRPALIHLMTIKGKGYTYAEQDPRAYHGIGNFDIETGESKKSGGFSEIFGEYLTSLAGQDERVCAVTAAMGGGTGLAPFAERFRQRYFDVGIAEQ